MVITSFTTLGNGISNYTSQNMGAGKMDRDVYKRQHTAVTGPRPS